MAEIIDEAIAKLMEKGLGMAAEQLEVTKRGLIASNLLTPSIDIPPLIAPEARLRRSDYGNAYLQITERERARFYDFEDLPIPRRTKNALEAAGCRSIEDVKFLIKQGRIRDIGVAGTTQIVKSLDDLEKKDM